MAGNKHQVLVIHLLTQNDSITHYFPILPLSANKIENLLEKEVNSNLFANREYMHMTRYIRSEALSEFNKYIKKFELFNEDFYNFKERYLPNIGVNCLGYLILDSDSIRNYISHRKRVNLDSELFEQQIEKIIIWGPRRGFLNGLLIISEHDASDYSTYEGSQLIYSQFSTDISELLNFLNINNCSKESVEDIKSFFWRETLTYALAETGHLNKSFEP